MDTENVMTAQYMKMPPGASTWPSSGFDYLWGIILTKLDGGRRFTTFSRYRIITSEDGNRKVYILIHKAVQLSEPDNITEVQGLQRLNFPPLISNPKPPIHKFMMITIFINKKITKK